MVRLLTHDTVPLYRTPDNAIYHYIKEAEREGAERSLYLKTGSDFDITVLTGKSTYHIDESIIFLDRIKLQGARKPLIKTTKRELDFEKTKWESDVKPPVYYFQERHKITLYPIPDIDYRLMIDGSRRPLEDMETPPELHESLTHWCLYRILSNPEADIYNGQEALVQLQKFADIFGHKRTAWFDNLHRNNSMDSSMNPNPFN